MLLCICRQELVESLRRSVLGYPDWVMLALEIVEGDRAFYHKVAGAVHPDFIRELGNQVLWHRSRECQRRQHYLLREHERPLQIAAAFSGFFLVQMLFL
mgnify:CR=1 FL=1